jgi:hypothetical protein
MAVIRPFDEMAAIEGAEMLKRFLKDGDKRAGDIGTWAKVKVDQQIVAIAKSAVPPMYTRRIQASLASLKGLALKQ